jgi:soluble lytic murein transglycosylase-like protein
MTAWGVLFIGIVLFAVFLFSGAKNLFGGTGPEKIIEEWIIYVSGIWGIEAALVKAVVKVESNFNPLAKNKDVPFQAYVSSYGLMQITMALAQDYGYVKVCTSPTMAELSKVMGIEVNLTIGTRFLKYLLSKNSFDIAVQMYNVGERGYNVLGRRATDYLMKVTRYYNEYRIKS